MNSDATQTRKAQSPPALAILKIKLYISCLYIAKNAKLFSDKDVPPNLCFKLYKLLAFLPFSIPSVLKFYLSCSLDSLIPGFPKGLHGIWLLKTKACKRNWQGLDEKDRTKFSRSFFAKILFTI